MTALLTADEAAGLRVGVNVIVRPGDPDPPMPNSPFPDVTGPPLAPQDWVALTGPCPTCKDSGWPGYVPADVSEMSGTALNDCGAGAPFKRCPNPDCRDGRRIVPLHTERPGSLCRCTINDDVCPFRTADNDPVCKPRRLLVGRAAVVSIEPEDDGHNFRITLDVVELAA